MIMLKALILVLAVQLIQSTENTRSSVLDLNEKFLDVKDDGHWFVEFYAPWCGHCKKLQPVWELMASDLAERTPRIRIGRIDCTRFTSVGSNLSIHGYPTIKYFRDGTVYTYDGDRSRAALIDFALKLEGPDVRHIGSTDVFLRLYTDFYLKGGFFVFVGAGKEEENSLKEEFRSIAKDSITKARFAEVSIELVPSNFTIFETPTILTFKDEVVRQYLASQEDLSLKDWIEHERWPLMPLISYGNLYDVGLCCNKLLVLVVSDLVERTKVDSPVKKFHDMVRQVAKSNADEFRPRFQFGWTDGNDLVNSVVLGQVPAPNLIVFDARTHEFYQHDEKDVWSSLSATPERLVIFLRAVANGEIQARGGRGVVQRIKRVSYDIFTTVYSMFSTQPLLSCCLFGLPIGILSVICYTLCSTDSRVDRDEIYKETDDDDEDYGHDEHDDAAAAGHRKYD